MVNYYINQVYRFYRSTKYNTEAINNILHGRSNQVDLLEHKDKYYPVTITNEHLIHNAFYGMSSIIREYSGYKHLIAAEIEHGVYFGKGGFNPKIGFPCIVTFGEERRKILRTKTNRPVFTIGPYIQYVDHHYNIDAVKQSIGRTLLVFPVHTLETISVKYGIDAFIDYIKQIQNQLKIDTILVSLYFSDLERYASIYENAGFIVVCSGHRMDKDFLARQKAFYELSDYVVTNGIGTHIGYAVSLNKPVSFYDQEMVYEFEHPERSKDAMPFQNEDVAEENIAKVKNAFRGFNKSINSEQIKIIEEFWGSSIKRTPQEFQTVFRMAEKVYKKSMFTKKAYIDLCENYLKLINDEEGAIIKNCIR